MGRATENVIDSFRFLVSSGKSMPATYEREHKVGNAAEQVE